MLYTSIEVLTVCPWPSPRSPEFLLEPNIRQRNVGQIIRARRLDGDRGRALSKRRRMIDKKAPEQNSQSEIALRHSVGCRTRTPRNPKAAVCPQELECPVVGDRPVRTVELEIVGIQAGIVTKMPVGSSPPDDYLIAICRTAWCCSLRWCRSTRRYQGSSE